MSTTNNVIDLSISIVELIWKHLSDKPDPSTSLYCTKLGLGLDSTIVCDLEAINYVARNSKSWLDETVKLVLDQLKKVPLPIPTYIIPNYVAINTYTQFLQISSQTFYPDQIKIPFSKIMPIAECCYHISLVLTEQAYNYYHLETSIVFSYPQTKSKGILSIEFIPESHKPLRESLIEILTDRLLFQ